MCWQKEILWIWIWLVCWYRRPLRSLIRISWWGFVRRWEILVSRRRVLVPCEDRYLCVVCWSRYSRYCYCCCYPPLHPNDVDLLNLEEESVFHNCRGYRVKVIQIMIGEKEGVKLMRKNGGFCDSMTLRSRERVISPIFGKEPEGSWETILKYVNFTYGRIPGPSQKK